MGYTTKAVAGFSWQTILKGCIAVVTVGKIFVLARLLDPTDFGIFSLITIALGVSEATTQTGVNVTIVQSKRSILYFLDTAWVIAIIRGLVIGSVMTVLGMVMSRFYQQPELMGLIGFASLVPVIKGFINPSIVTLQKELKFFEDSAYRFAITVTDAILAILIGLVLHSVMALVLALIGAALIEVAISFYFFKHRPRFQFVRSAATMIFANAKWLSFSALFSYLHENLDNVLIGKLTSTHLLGVYHNSYSLGHKANYDFAKSAAHSTFPIFAKLKGDRARAIRAFLRSTGVAIGLILLTSLPLLLFPGLFVQLILGDKWLEAIPVTRWLVLAGLLQSITHLLSNFEIAHQRYLAVNAHLAASVITMVGLLLFFTPQHGLIGAAWAIVLSRIVTLPIIGWSVVQSIRKTSS